MIRRIAVAILALGCLWLTNFSWIYGNGGTYQTYYISTTGNDGNPGTAGSPWATANHAVNCGDTIIVGAGTYSNDKFTFGNWGTVSNCPASNGLYFAKFQCAGPLVTSCAYSSTASVAVGVDHSNWAVIGGKISTSAGGGAICFDAEPRSTANIHHIAVINVVANGCDYQDITAQAYYANGAFGVDYFAAVGIIAYGNTGSSTSVLGVELYRPANVDAAAGTHYFVAGLFAWGNIDPGHIDGGGILFDTWNANSYTGKAVLEQSITVANGGYGISCFENTAAPITVNSTTLWGNHQDASFNYVTGELNVNDCTTTGSVTYSGNIAQANVQTVNGHNAYAAAVQNTDGTTSITNNYLFGVAGNNTSISSSPGFSYGTNTTATPNFVNPTVPGAPDCTGAALVTTCPTVVTIVANFVAQAAGAVGLGYQPPGACTPDALFPVWLKGIIPNGLITKPCGM